MDTPPSPPPPPSKPQPPTQSSHRTAESIPLNSPLRTHPKRGLPPTFASTYPHGHISGHPRTAEQQAAFDARKAEILRTMGRQDIEKAYEDVVCRIREELEESERRGGEVESEMEKLRMEREMERRVWGKLRGMKESGG
ncbi:hypothetical protein HO173_004551 [Letharia columbiana]|uniref:Uncharacterized protein n=1 Tax=Letharia columbiana TaxID=112416 RepID=A0A8H6FYA4_9LECA|nr:uncharacterized protein HO173_004551 [Letharia columbiana]KAF6237084.1 hypothetical protein HO173_004551 [Letharia columbiana]